MKFSGKLNSNGIQPIEGEIIHSDGLQLFGFIQLFYRDELGDHLGIRYAHLRNYTDADLVLVAYKKWGSEMLAYLYGAWSFVLFDDTKKSAILTSDISENTSLFYMFQNDSLYFSSSTTFFKNQSLFDLEIDELEFVKLSMRLVGNSVGKTVIKGLFYISPKEYILFKSFKNFIRIKNPKKNFIRVRYKEDKDYFLQFRSLMANAVLCRLNNSKNPGIFLSSGLDSTTVCSFLLKAYSGGNSVHTYTSVPFYVDARDDDQLVSEQSLVEYFLKNRSNVKASFLQFPGASFEKELMQASFNDLFFPVVHSNSFWVKGILEQAKHDGVDRMFTGQIGNYSISFRGDTPTISISIARTLRFLKSMLFGEYLFKKQQWKYSVIRNQLLRNMWRCNAIEADFKLGYTYNYCVSTFRKKSFEKIHCFVSNHWSFLAQEYGILVVDPTSDRRLGSFLDSIPSKIFYKKGIPKYLLKQSMLGFLPQNILFNRFPKPQSADIGRRLKRENFLSEIVFNLIEKYKNSDFFDVAKLKTVHERLMSTKSRQEQHVLSFHLLYMISMIKCYDGLQTRKN